MKKHADIDFNRNIRDGGMGVKRVLIALAAVLVLGVVIFAAVLAINDFDFTKFLGAEDPSEDVSAESDAVTGQDSFAAPFSDASAINVLMICHSEKTVTFCELISFSAAENSIRVKPVSPELLLPFGGKQARISEIFYDFGAAEIARALGEKNVTVHRYFSVSEPKLKLILQKFGNVTVNLPGRVDVNVDAIRYQFPKGAQELTPDALLGLIKYAYEDDDALSFQAEAVAGILRTCFTLETMQRDDSFFSDVVNLIDGNLTAFDFAEYKPRIIEFITNEPEISVIS